MTAQSPELQGTNYLVTSVEGHVYPRRILRRSAWKAWSTLQIRKPRQLLFLFRIGDSWPLMPFCTPAEDANIAPVRFAVVKRDIEEKLRCSQFP